MSNYCYSTTWPQPIYGRPYWNWPFMSLRIESDQTDLFSLAHAMFGKEFHATAFLWWRSLAGRTSSSDDLDGFAGAWYEFLCSIYLEGALIVNAMLWMSWKRMLEVKFLANWFWLNLSTLIDSTRFCSREQILFRFSNQLEWQPSWLVSFVSINIRSNFVPMYTRCFSFLCKAFCCWISDFYQVICLFYDTNFVRCP